MTVQTITLPASLLTFKASDNRFEWKFRGTGIGEAEILLELVSSADPAAFLAIVKLSASGALEVGIYEHQNSNQTARFSAEFASTGTVSLSGGGVSFSIAGSAQRVGTSLPQWHGTVDAVTFYTHHKNLYDAGNSVDIVLTIDDGLPLRPYFEQTFPNNYDFINKSSFNFNFGFNSGFPAINSSLLISSSGSFAVLNIYSNGNIDLVLSNNTELLPQVEVNGQFKVTVRSLSLTVSFTGLDRGGPTYSFNHANNETLQDEVIAFYNAVAALTSVVNSDITFILANGEIVNAVEISPGAVSTGQPSAALALTIADAQPRDLTPGTVEVGEPSASLALSLVTVTVRDITLSGGSTGPPSAVLALETRTEGAYEQVIELPAIDYLKFASFGIATWAITAGQRTRIIDGLAGAEEKYLVAVTVFSDGRVRLGFGNNTSTSDQDGDDLSDDFEANGSVMLEYQSDAFTAELAGADLTEPYQWTPSNANEVKAFYNALPAVRAAARLTLRAHPTVVSSIDLSLSAGSTGQPSAELSVSVADAQPRSVSLPAVAVGPPSAALVLTIASGTPRNINPGNVSTGNPSASLALSVLSATARLVNLPEVSAGAPSASLALAIGDATPRNINPGNVSTGNPSASLALSVLSAPLTLNQSRLPATGLIEFQAVLKKTDSNAAVLYADSDRSGTDTPIEGDLNLTDGAAVAPFSRIRLTGSILALNDNGDLSLSSYFGSSGTGRDLIAYIQVGSEFESFAIESGIRSPIGGGYVNINMPADFATLARTIGVGTRYIFAMYRLPTATPVEVTLSGVSAGPPSASLAVTLASSTPRVLSLSAGSTGQPSAELSVSVADAQPRSVSLPAVAVGPPSAALVLTIASGTPRNINPGNVSTGNPSAALALAIGDATPRNINPGNVSTGNPSASLALSVLSATARLVNLPEVSAGAPSASLAVTPTAAPLTLNQSRLPATGLIEFQAVLKKTDSNAAVLYADSDRSGTDTPIEGDLNLTDGAAVAPFSRIRLTGSILALNDNGDLSLSSYFGSSGTGRDLIAYIQVGSEFESFAIESGIRSPIGGGYVNINMPADFATLARTIGVGTRYIFAMYRLPTATPVEVTLSGVSAGPPSASLAVTLASSTPRVLSLSAGSTGQPSAELSVSVADAQPRSVSLPAVAVGPPSAALVLTIASGTPRNINPGNVSTGNPSASLALSVLSATARLVNLPEVSAGPPSASLAVTLASSTPRVLSLSAGSTGQPSAELSVSVADAQPRSVSLPAVAVGPPSAALVLTIASGTPRNINPGNVSTGNPSASLALSVLSATARLVNLPEVSAGAPSASLAVAPVAATARDLDLGTVATGVPSASLVLSTIALMPRDLSPGNVSPGNVSTGAPTAALTLSIITLDPREISLSGGSVGTPSAELTVSPTSRDVRAERSRNLHNMLIQPAELRTKTTRPALTRPAAESPVEMQQFIDGVIEHLEALSPDPGRGLQLDKAVTWRNLLEDSTFLLDGNFYRFGGGAALMPAPAGTTTGSPFENLRRPGFVPGAVTGFKARTAYDLILLIWDFYNDEIVRFNIALTEIYRTTSSMAPALGPSSSDIIAIVAGDETGYADDPPGDSPVKYWYWIRYVSIENIAGPLVGPATATTLPVSNYIADFVGTYTFDPTQLPDASQLGIVLDNIGDLSSLRIAVSQLSDVENLSLKLNQLSNLGDLRIALSQVSDLVDLRITLSQLSNIGDLRIAASHVSGLDALQITLSQLSDIGDLRIAASQILHFADGPLTIQTTTVNGEVVETPILKANSVVANNIIAGAIVAGKLAADAVLAKNITAGAIVAGKLAADAVLAKNITAGAIAAGHIATGAVIADKIASNVILARHILTGQIAAKHMSVTSISPLPSGDGTESSGTRTTGVLHGDWLVPASLEAGRLKVGTITGRELGDGTISTVKLQAVLESDNFEAGVSGWRISRAGIIELNEGVYRGQVRSLNFLSGSSGWILRPDGTGELDAALIRGTLAAGHIDSDVANSWILWDNPAGTDISSTSADITFDLTTPLTGFTSLIIVGEDIEGNNTGFGVSAIPIEKIPATVTGSGANRIRFAFNVEEIVISSPSASVVNMRRGSGNDRIKVYTLIGQRTPGISPGTSTEPPATGTDTAGSVSISDTTPMQGTSIRATLTDPDNPNSHGYQWLSGGSTISGATSQDYTPVAADVGNRLSCRVAYSDDFGNQSETSSETSNVAALSVDAMPNLPNQDNVTYTTGASVSLTLPASSTGDTPLTYSLSGLSGSGLSFNASSRRISGTAGTVGSYACTYRVEDDDGDTDTDTFTITIGADVVSAPSIPRNTAASGGVEEFTFYWSAPSNDGGETPTYEVRYQRTGGSVVTRDGITATQLTVSGLAAGSYTMWVRAENSGGESDFTPGEVVTVTAAAAVVYEASATVGRAISSTSPNPEVRGYAARPFAIYGATGGIGSLSVSDSDSEISVRALYQFLSSSSGSSGTIVVRMPTGTPNSDSVFSTMILRYGSTTKRLTRTSASYSSSSTVGGVTHTQWSWTNQSPVFPTSGNVTVEFER